MAIDPGTLTVLSTILILLSFGLVSMSLVVISRRRIARQDCEAEKGQATTKSVSVSQYPPQLPNFSTRSSLSMSSEPFPSESPPTPGIRFVLTTPSHRSRRSVSIDSLPCMETVSERYEQEADAINGHVEDVCDDVIASGVQPAEAGPSVMLGRD